MFGKIVRETLRVPAVLGAAGDGAVIARQLDIALMDVGFKLSGEVLGHLSKLHPVVVKDTASEVLAAVRELVGDHVKHNVYFRDFPKNVPDTVEFWMECLADALCDPASAGTVSPQLSFGVVNLLDLPKYGRYQHSYEEMIAAHEKLIPSAKDRVTVLHLGKSLSEEALALYHSLAESAIPLNESDRQLLGELAEVCLADPQPKKIPARENRAIINRVRIENNLSLLADTPTDILRAACALSKGDVTLQEETKFKSFPRRIRRELLAALDEVVRKSPEKLADIGQYREPWKRLGERLHPHEYREFPHAKDAFAVARGDRKVRSLAAKAELAFAEGDITEAVALLANAPGMLFRNLDRVLRAASEPEAATLLKTAQTVIGKVSGRVILSVREHLQNRASKTAARIFANSKGSAWVAEDTRKPLDQSAVKELFGIFDAELLRRLPEMPLLTVDPVMLNLAVPLSDKNKAAGFGIMPRGSILPVANGILRFFVYWKQRHARTDYDLSVLLLDRNFQYAGQRSWTNLRGSDGVAVHSGDLIEAANGASEFIDIDLARINCSYIVPQVNIYAGENFSKVEECFFGFMERTPEQKGKPFEARTVRMKSDMRGSGKVALPLVFAKDGEGAWSAKWLHLYLKGSPSFNRVEANRVSAALLARTVMEREYLRLEYLVGLLRCKTESRPRYADTRPAVYIGLEAPETAGESKVYTLRNLSELIPA